MRILYYSDIHTEMTQSVTRLLSDRWTDLYPLHLGPRLADFVGCVDLVVLAGDIGPGRLSSGISSLLYAEQVHAYLAVPVVLVPGNHEYYGYTFEDTRDHLLSAEASGVHVLDRREANFTINGRALKVLGATLWTDYAVMGDPSAGRRAALHGLNDHRLILTNRGTRWTPEDALKEHETSRRWLLERLQEAHEGSTLVATHHVPHSAAHKRPGGLDALSASFVSDRDDLLQAAREAEVAGWIFGHNHANLVIEQDGVRLMTAQPGYPRENTGWTGPKVLAIDLASPKHFLLTEHRAAIRTSGTRRSCLPSRPVR